MFPWQKKQKKTKNDKSTQVKHPSEKAAAASKRRDRLEWDPRC